MARLRVVLDTNVLVSGLAYPDSIPGRIVGAWKMAACLWCFPATFWMRW